MTPDDSWTWWANRDQILVGPLAHEAFAEDVPVVAVRDAKDAQLLVAILDYLDAKAVAS